MRTPVFPHDEDHEAGKDGDDEGGPPHFRVAGEEVKQIATEERPDGTAKCVTARNEPHCEAHDFEPQMGGGKARRRWHGGIVEQAEHDREDEHHLIARADIHEHDEGKRAHEIDRAEKERAVHPVGQIAGQKHTAEIDRRDEAVNARGGDRREAAKGGIGQKMGLDRAGCRDAADEKAPEENMECLVSQKEFQARPERLLREVLPSLDDFLFCRLQHDPDDNGHSKAGHADKRQTPAPRKMGEADGEQRNCDELPRCSARIGYAGGKAAVLVEEFGQSRRDEMHVCGGEADAANDAVTHNIQPGDGEECEGQKCD